MNHRSASAAVLLDDSALSDVGQAGGKAAALAELRRHFDVPPFVVIAADAFEAGDLTPAAAAILSAALADLGPGPFAVRSSGREEDGSDAAHAGQFDTELNVEASVVAEAAGRVWLSGTSDTLMAYRRARGLADTPQPPAVLIQQMVDARAAGVAFSADPVSGNRAHVVISAVSGLADRLVGGEVDGDQYWIGTASCPATDHPDVIVDDAPVLRPPERVAVASLARRTAAHFGVPQDIEWAFEGDRLYLLQSRPITTLPEAPPPNGEFDDGLPVLWDNANIVESYPGIVSPLTYSFARHVYAHVYRAFARLMGVSATTVDEHRTVFENLLGRLRGRVYYNLLNWYRALALFPGFKANRAFMEGMMGTEALPPALAERIAPRNTTGRERLWDQVRLARVGLGLLWQQIILKRSIRRFGQRLDDALARVGDDIDRMSAPALVAEYRHLEQRLLSRWDAPLVNDFICMVAFGLSRRMLERWAGPAGLELHADMLIGQGDIVSAEPARLIREMGRLAADTDDALVQRLLAGDAQALQREPSLAAATARYIDKFGDRCAQELKLESRTLHEDASPLARAVGAAALATGANLTTQRSGRTPRHRLADLLAGKPLRRWLAGALIDWARVRVRDRENLRFERTRLFGRVRRIFLALGQRLCDVGLLSEPRDVFCLTVEEALGAVGGSTSTDDLPSLVRLRQREMTSFAALPDPPHRLLVRGVGPAGLAAAIAAQASPGQDDAAHRDRSDASEDTVAGGDVRSGLACCRGIVTAPVRVIADPRHETLQPGEILVARHTDPGWIAAFAAAAGVIAERGSLLSHSAIVAREMGVPCVVAVADVTQWLRTGDMVRLDGGRGVIERLAPRPASASTEAQEQLQ
jgi:phosphohistidine swiveling domain-containing protein